MSSSSEPKRDLMDGEADKAPNDRAVDADILQIRPHIVLKLFDDGCRVPTADRLRNEAPDITAVAFRYLCQQGSQAPIEYIQNFLVLQHCSAEALDPFG